MKANRKFINKDAGVSAVYGVLLMVAITVAILITVYFYVSNMLSDYNAFTITGKIKSMPITTNWYGTHNIIIDNKTIAISYLYVDDYDLLKSAYCGNLTVSFDYETYYDTCNCNTSYSIIRYSVKVFV